MAQNNNNNRHRIGRDKLYDDNNQRLKALSRARLGEEKENEFPSYTASAAAAAAGVQKYRLEGREKGSKRNQIGLK